MDRRTYIEGLGAAVTTGALAGCTGNGSNGGNGTGGGNGDGNGGTDDDGGEDGGSTEYGLLSTSVTDQPNDIGDFESLIVTIRGIWVKPKGRDSETDEMGDVDEDGGEDVNGTASDGGELNGTEDGAVDGGDEEEDEDDEENADDEGADEDTDEETTDEADEDVDESAGRYYIEFEEPQDADLVQLQGDNTRLIDETELEVGEYQFLQLDVEETNGTLESDGEEAVVETPGNAPLQFKHAFEIRAEERTHFIADFAPFRRGNGEYLIRPVASGTQVLYGDAEPDDGGSDGEDNETDADTDEDADVDSSDDADGGS